MSRNYASPYAKQLPQYPSQSEDYISLEIGGPGKCSTPARPQYTNRLNSKGTGGGNSYYQNRQQRGHGSHQKQQNRFSGNCQNNRNSTGGFAGGEWQQQTPRSSGVNEWQRRGGGGGYRQRNNRQSFNSKVCDISSYVHPSMLEDPWKDLNERRDAIKRSEINLNTFTKENKEIDEDDAASSANEGSCSDGNDDKESEMCAVSAENNEATSP
ncbi:uncharacterized protein [Eurosta solidaginis]|uniref:uncharacterized protein n=1 Tax=Eurosta solidaginis TaxID=178769 RepID=UPI0035308500